MRIADFPMSRQDANITIGLAPPTNINGWSLQFDVMPRFDGTPLFSKYAASGYTTSGITINDQSQGVMTVSVSELNLSGFDYGNYAYQLKRTNSGNITPLVQGYIILTP